MFVQAGSQAFQSLQGQPEEWELALAYTIRIHLETGSGRVAGENAGTQEQWRESALACMWRIHMETAWQGRGGSKKRSQKQQKFVGGEG